MNGLAENSLTSIDPGQLILASPDGGWCDQVEAALMASDDLTGLVTWRVKQLCQLDLFLQLPSGLWLVDEIWASQIMARRRLAAGRPAPPELIVRFDRLSKANAVAMIESGARGCLSHDASTDEVLRAIRAVRDGELWLSRRVFSQVLAHVQARVTEPEHGHVGLTERQREIVACVARGLSNKQIGRQLGISPTTVKTHLHNIFERVGIGGRTLLALRSTAVEPIEVQPRPPLRPAFNQLQRE